MASADYNGFYQSKADAIAEEVKKERQNAKQNPHWHERFKQDRIKLSFLWDKLSKIHKRKKLTPVVSRVQGSKFVVNDF